MSGRRGARAVSRGVVADADDDVWPGRRQVPAKPLDEGVFSAFADGHWLASVPARGCGRGGDD